jgi:HK97 family phage major capsid protein
MNSELIAKFNVQGAGNDGAQLMTMSKSFDETAPADIRVKSAVEMFSHNPQTLVYKNQGHAKLMGLGGEPILYGSQPINMATERTKAMSAVWMKLQMFPESLNEREKGIVRYILNREKFFMPSDDALKTSARHLSESERHEVLKGHMEFYGMNKAAVVNDTGTGGQYATPEFFDMDMIVAPTLAASENIAGYCNVIPVPRGAAAQNFVLGRPTIAAANETDTSGTPTAVFSPTGFITDHDTTFFRAAGFIELGRNFIEDAHPGLVAEIQQQYLRSVRLWFNEQIMNGDGTTEPQGVKNASGTADITPSTPTTGPVTLSDVFRMLFGVNKAYREDGGRGNAIYVMTDTTYGRIRAIATGVTGDTRLVFGEDIESYRLFGHPVLIEQQGMDNGDLVFMQAKGYRLYLRQGARFIREDRGDTLVRRNTFLIGVDVRAGGKLDLGGYASVADALLVT